MTRISGRLTVSLAAVLLVASGSVSAQSTAPVPGSPPSPSAAPAPAASALVSPTPATSGEPLSAGTLPDGVDLAWRQLRSGDRPAAREDHTWTVDPVAGSAWLFGGRDGATAFDDLWRYDLAADTWSPVQPMGGRRPEARFGHAAAWVPGVGLVIFAGQRGADFFDDLWAFDPAAGSWRKLPSRGASPAARYGTCAALGPDGRLWISHGFTFRGRFDDTRAYDFEAGTWHNETPADRRPSERCLHDCFFSADGRLVLYAGQNNEEASLGDAWALRPDVGWQRLPDPPAAPRRLYGLALDSTSAWISGGAARDGSLHDDLWRVDRGTLEWRRAGVPGERPPGRSAPGFVTDGARERLLLFGGQGPNARRSDLWQLGAASSVEG